MEKQTFQIPEGCKAITVEQIGNQLVHTFEVERKFKDGDILISEKIGWAIYIYRKTDKPENGYFYCLFDSSLGLSFADGSHYGYTSTTRLATQKEAQKLFDALKEEGKRWNPKTKQVELLRWRAKHGENYYYLDFGFIVAQTYECSHTLDDERHETGNYFRTKEQAERAKPYLQKALNDFWKEELR